MRHQRIISCIENFFIDKADDLGTYTYQACRNTRLNSTLLEMFTRSTMNWAQDDRRAAELFAKNITYLAVPRASNRDDHPIVRPRRQITPQDLTIFRIGGETEATVESCGTVHG